MFNNSQLYYTDDQLNIPGHGVVHEALHGLDFADELDLLFGDLSDANFLSSPTGPTSMASYNPSTSYPGADSDAFSPSSWASMHSHVPTYDASRLSNAHVEPQQSTFSSASYTTVTPTYSPSYTTDTLYSTSAFANSSLLSPMTSLPQINYPTQPVIDYTLPNIASTTPSPTTPVPPTIIIDDTTLIGSSSSHADGAPLGAQVSPHNAEVELAQFNSARHRSLRRTATDPYPMVSGPTRTEKSSLHRHASAPTPAHRPLRPPLFALPGRLLRVEYPQTWADPNYIPTSTYTVHFTTNGAPGFSVRDIRAGRFEGLDNPDELTMLDLVDRKVHIRIDLPGATETVGVYMWTKDDSGQKETPPSPLVPISRRVLAQRIASVLASAGSQAQRLLDQDHKTRPNRRGRRLITDTNDLFITYISPGKQGNTGWVFGIEHFISV